MKITIVTSFFLPVPPVRGGSTEKIWYELARRFAAGGHQVTIVSRSWPGFPPRETDGGVTHIRLPGADHTRHLALNLIQDAIWGMRVSRALPPADVVVCNTVTLPIWLRWLKPSAGQVVPVLARMPKGHGRAYRSASLILSLSEAVSAKLRQENPALARRIAAFPYPIDWHTLAAARRSRTDTGVVRIGFIGRVHPEKGLDLLLAAAARLSLEPGLPPWRLEITGPTTIPQGGGGETYVAELRKYVGEACERAAFHEPVFDSAALATRYAELDVFCYPSIAEAGETFGVAVAEAMAAGCCPVVSALDCFRELIHPGTTGLVFDHRAPDAIALLAGALRQLLMDHGLRSRLSAAAQEHARRFDYAESARSVLRQLENLQHGASTRAPGSG